MPNYRFRNYHVEAIRILLKDIGYYEFHNNLERMQLQKPKRMRGFYLESNLECVFLVYKYPEGTRNIMKVDRYLLPLTGWELFED